MKYLLILPIILISLCVQLPGLPFDIPIEQPQIITEDIGSQDLFIKVETLSSEIRAGRSIQVFVELRNKQFYDLENVNFEVYDYPCFDVSGNEFTENCGTLSSNESCSWSSRWRSQPDITTDTHCSIKFRVSYEASNSIFQDIAVLSQSEYTQREIDGTLQNIPIQSTSAKGPLNIYLTFSEPQPFLADQSGYNMYINYQNRGKGFFGDDLSITIAPPNNIGLTCSDYGTDFILDRELTFIKGKAVRSICDFDTSSVPTISIRSLGINIDYSYTIHNSISIMVKPSTVISLPPTTPSEPSDFDFSTNPTSETITAGESTEPSITITVTEGSFERITRSVASISPSEPTITAVIRSPFISNIGEVVRGSTTWMDVSTQTTTPPGTYTITVRAEGEGVTKEATYDLTVE